ncbi:BRCT domain [Macleaya cordata]|uniref:BRCT domain n=1 Tax=Macleaya cordata TaxID=56857 RepID=A0A200Q1H3_MACCD|nr:BRCT domain [Macleaya cordata]
MSSDGDDETHSTKEAGNSNTRIDIDMETQPFDSDDESPLEFRDLNGDEFQCTEPFIGTIPVESETQVLEDWNCDENLMTQLLVDETQVQVFTDEEDDEEDSDRTEVLTEAEGVSDDESERGGVGVNDDDEQGEKGKDTEGASDDESERGGIGDDDDDEQGEKEKDVAVDFNDSTNEQRRNSGKNVSTTTPLDNGIKEPNSGSVRRSFMSVRTASLRASGLAAARRMSFEGTDTNLGSIPSNSQPGKEHIRKDDGMTDLGDPASIGKKRMEVDRDCGSGDIYGNTKTYKDEIRNRGAVRKLFTDDDDDTPVANNEGINDNDNFNGGRDRPELDNGHEFAGLSYVDSQEPGELSQANALDIVDRFLLVNNVECSQEDKDYPGITVKGKSPSVPSAKGPQTLACRTNTRIPVGEVGIFDWVDSREDEGGGDFFSKRKEVLFKSNEHGRKSFTQPKNPRHLNFRKGKDSIRSDSRLMLQNVKEDHNTVQIPETKAKKNLFEELDEQLNPEPSEQQLEALDISKSPPEKYDVGIDTQMAAEAMEALVCGVPANHDTADAFQAIPNTRGVMKNRSHSEHASVQKRVSSSDIGGVSKQSKRTKTLDTKLSGEAPISSRIRSKNPTVEEITQESTLKTNRKKGRSKAEEHPSTRNAATGFGNSGRRSSKFVGQRREVGVVDRSHAKEVDKCHSSFELNGNNSFSKWLLPEDSRTFTPVTRRTRQSQAVNELKKTTNLFNDSGERKEDLMEVNILGGKRVRSKMGIDAPEQLTKGKYSKSGSNLIGDVNRPTLHEPLGLDGQHVRTTKTLCEKRKPREKRTCRRVSGHLNGPGNLHNSSAVVDGVIEANGQSITTPNGLNVDVRITFVNLDMKRKTRSSISRHPSSSGKNSEGHVIVQDLVEPTLTDAAVNCSLPVNEKKVIKGLVKEKVSKHSGKKGDADSLSTPKGIIGGNARLEGSPGEKLIPSGSLCVTPINCTTPINATTPVNEASPVCIGNNYQKRSCKKSLSKSSLTRELNNLCTDPVRTLAFKDLRKRRDMASIRVLFSHHLDEDIIKQQKKILARLGVSITSSSSEATHFVTDKFVRTRNMLEAIALGKPVVTHLWLESCGQASCFIDERNYILRDSKKEKEIGFSMPVSLSRACQSPLLEGQRVFVTPNVKPGKEVVASLVKAVNGQAVERIGRSVMNDDKVLEDLLVLSCEEDYEICMPLLEKGVAVYSSELLLNGIVIQKLEYERHRLFSEHVKRTRSTIWIRKDGDQFLPIPQQDEQISYKSNVPVLVADVTGPVSADVPEEADKLKLESGMTLGRHKSPDLPDSGDQVPQLDEQISYKSDIPVLAADAVGSVSSDVLEKADDFMKFEGSRSESPDLPNSGDQVPQSDVENPDPLNIHGAGADSTGSTNPEDPGRQTTLRSMKEILVPQSDLRIPDSEGFTIHGQSEAPGLLNTVPYLSSSGLISQSDQQIPDSSCIHGAGNSLEDSMNPEKADGSNGEGNIMDPSHTKDPDHPGDISEDSTDPQKADGSNGGSDILGSSRTEVPDHSESMDRTNVIVQEGPMSPENTGERPVNAERSNDSDLPLPCTTTGPVSDQDTSSYDQNFEKPCIRAEDKETPVLEVTPSIVAESCNSGEPIREDKDTSSYDQKFEELSYSRRQRYFYDQKFEEPCVRTEDKETPVLEVIECCNSVEPIPVDQDTSCDDQKFEELRVRTDNKETPVLEVTPSSVTAESSNSEEPIPEDQCEVQLPTFVENNKGGADDNKSKESKPSEVELSPQQVLADLSGDVKIAETPDVSNAVKDVPMEDVLESIVVVKEDSAGNVNSSSAVGEEDIFADHSEDLKTAETPNSSNAVKDAPMEDVLESVEIDVKEGSAGNVNSLSTSAAVGEGILADLSADLKTVETPNVSNAVKDVPMVDALESVEVDVKEGSAVNMNSLSTSAVENIVADLSEDLKTAETPNVSNDLKDIPMEDVLESVEVRENKVQQTMLTHYPPLLL